MCGIAGKISFDGRLVTESNIRRMTDRLRHRGPDDEGWFIDSSGRIGLGHRRLSIIDLSPAGHQPMIDAEGRFVIVFNGEIYNYKELARKLRSPHQRKSKTDTEVILHLWAELGTEALTHLRGMFAFAIWDQRDRVLTLARDRLGKKPLKYYLGPDQLVFASELKAFLEEPGVPKQLDLQAVSNFLTFQYVPHPQTGFQKILKLPPANFLTVDLSASRPVIRGPISYWSLNYTKKLHYSTQEWSAQILSKLRESVALRLVADVPLGAFLSGGIDSSAVVGLMAQEAQGRVKTFSIGFREKSHNELDYARLVAQRFDTDHTEFIVDPPSPSHIPQLVRGYEEPYADSSALPTFLLAQLTRQHVTVALNGDGGDESFAGYPWTFAQKAAAMIDRLPLGLNAVAAGLVARIPIPNIHPSSRRLAAFARSLGYRGRKRYRHYPTTSFFSDDDKERLFQPTVITQIHLTRLPPPWEGPLLFQVDDPIDLGLGMDIQTYLVDDLLVKVDIATMMNGLEARSPFLDHEFVELAAQIPSSLKLAGRTSKAILKTALRDLLPAPVLEHKKHGFMIPIDAWLRDSNPEWATSVLFDPHARMNEWIRPEEVKRFYEEHQSGKQTHGNRLWTLLVFEHWLQSYFS